MIEQQSSLADQKRKTVETAEFTPDGRYKRKVRSFVLRTGRLSDFQRNMMNDHWHIYGLSHQDQPFDFKEIYGNDNPVVLEIGFGMGKSLVEMAEQNPDKNYLGIEVHTPGVGACIAYAVEKKVKNLRVICHDATEILRDCIADGSLAGLQLFFPDPWHKAKHHKRRIVQPHFVQTVCEKLANQGFIHMATDWENYAEQMLEVLQKNTQLCNTSETDDYIPRPESRPLTKFEQRGYRLGHSVWDLYFIKTG
ncbi:tRNA (guanosine(46)-N7)-methyltransferase TrmB [Avibacterium paragallinarum]|uniref:tRNA (guanine-N(7)-)-methyltransferase n=1 Tax=Avibacterium paragallinarum TaxID=728 RepID=A0A0F5ETA6_AVIPA|nr:tRNA (guanosine(46)-N7)-methyltransferase TrmB [Avibacterium paragallinarum]AZI15105.1 tRNA (guanosine(46)-N7)-methyltransferase TrmB [Avibacterium paragallinarum]MEE3609147.1 tRNA (guanosine(46)-N7)-methyltransferase TrmB [Avibacterium paragallinarum]MEE3621155.1 tRNA (guanosine(46)-N7)-methyltransferase TrmB [Avibacterium paragallinarum]MEE3668937.1 tRNA (guanosine(46)-N7)-methyltransferase TrmB [Avibacterium paragallinarum]MEE3681111.1 tRNA (guanosine(46)-N7)-methyltransferase TrmB [Avib